MKKLRLTFAGVFAAALTSTAAPTDIRLNEVNLNVPGPDGNFEFIELKSINNIAEPLTGLSIVIINNDRVDADDGTAKNIGEIREVLSLNDLSTGSNGLLLLGNGYTANPRGGPWSGFIDPATAVGDPAGLGDSDIGSNDGLTILLVSGASPLLVKGADVDVDNNQLVDWGPGTPANAQFTTQPWTTLVDSIGTRDRGKDNNDLIANPYVITSPNGGAVINIAWASSALGDRDPDTFARQLGNDTPNSAGSWYGGKLHGTTPTTITYESPTRIFGPGGMLGEVTPGRANLASTLGATSFRINEVGLNPVGDNDRFQYIEIINTGTAANGFVPTARSLNGYWLVMVDSYDNPSTPNDEVGTVIEKWDLSSMATGTNGLLLIGNDFTATYNSFLDLASPQSGFGDPESHDAIPADGTIPAIPAATGMSEGDIGFKNGFTLYLVQNLSATAPADIDTNNDGIIDTPIAPAANIADQVGFSQVGKTGKGRTYSTVDLRTVMPTEMVPDNFGRKPKAGNLMAVAATEWYGGVYPGGSPGFDVAYSTQKVTPSVGAPYDPVFGGYRGAGTPGLPNLS
ncbi:MAG TPA: hypothetical protein VHM91_02670, partial [Verrucomicrobiales bacterium]|nr:hypothetical protein [Verrucomicrobiales bacterium]